MGLVDDDQAGGGRQPGEHLVAEARVVEALGADQQHVGPAGADLVVHLLPLLDVAGVDRHAGDAGALRCRDLVAHQGEQRADDDGGSGTASPQQGCRDEVDRRLAPAGALHDERSAVPLHQGGDRRPLVLAQHRVRTGEGLKNQLGLGTQGARHPLTLPGATDERPAGRQRRRGR